MAVRGGSEYEGEEYALGPDRSNKQGHTGSRYLREERNLRSGDKKEQQHTETSANAQLMRMEAQMQEMKALLQSRHENAANAGLNGPSNDIQATGSVRSSGLKQAVWIICMYVGHAVLANLDLIHQIRIAFLFHLAYHVCQTSLYTPWPLASLSPKPYSLQAYSLSYKTTFLDAYAAPRNSVIPDSMSSTAMIPPLDTALLALQFSCCLRP